MSYHKRNPNELKPITKIDVNKRTKPVMLLIDANNILWRTAAVAIGPYKKPMIKLHRKENNNTILPHEQKEYDMMFEEFVKIWKNIVFSMIRNIVNKHKPNEVIICRDSPDTWREMFFPYYKGKRKLDRIKNSNDAPYSTSRFYKEISNTISEINNILHYHDLKCAMCEADDTISVISQLMCELYDIIISSTDKDFAQLINDDGSIKFYEHHKKVFLDKTDKESFDEMILLGDKSDGIPRMLDSDDSIVEFRDFTKEEMELPEEEREKIKRELRESPKERRPSFGMVKVKNILKKCEEDGISLMEYAENNNRLDHYMRNKMLFSLDINDMKKNVPDIVEIIKEQFLKLEKKSQSFIEMQKYFMKRRMIEQLDKVEEFILPKFKNQK